MVELGAVTGGLIWMAGRWPILGWVAYVPLGSVWAWGSPAQAGLAAAFAGALGSARSVSIPEFRALLPITVVPSALAWGFASFFGALLASYAGAASLALLLPATVALGLVPLRILGAPRFVSNPLACTQERFLPVVHTARLGGDLTTTAVMVLASASIVLAATGELATACTGALLVLVALALGAAAARTTMRRLATMPRVCVAAVVADGPPPDRVLTGLWPMQSPDYRDVEATIRRYEPHVQRAAGLGAELVLLPEVAVYVDAISRARWIEAATAWARALRVTVIAPMFDASVPVNTLSVIDDSGVRATYDKQHPVRGMEPPPRARLEPRPLVVRTKSGSFPLSTVICVDLDYGDLIRPVRRAGGILVAPSNDWFGGFDVCHHSTAVWAAVTTGVTTIRATGHGISAILNGAGRILAERSSADGPVVLVVDAPTAGFIPYRDTSSETNCVRDARSSATRNASSYALPGGMPSGRRSRATARRASVTTAKLPPAGAASCRRPCDTSA